MRSALIRSWKEEGYFSILRMVPGILRVMLSRFRMELRQGKLMTPRHITGGCLPVTPTYYDYLVC